MKDTTITGLNDLSVLLTSKYECYSVNGVDTVYSNGDTLYNVFLTRQAVIFYPSDTITPCEIKPFDNRSANEVIGHYRDGYSPNHAPHQSFDFEFLLASYILILYIIIRFLIINIHCWALLPKKYFATLKLLCLK